MHKMSTIVLSCFVLYQQHNALSCIHEDIPRNVIQSAMGRIDSHNPYTVGNNLTSETIRESLKNALVTKTKSSVRNGDFSPVVEQATSASV